MIQPPNVSIAVALMVPLAAGLGLLAGLDQGLLALGIGAVAGLTALMIRYALLTVWVLWASAFVTLPVAVPTNFTVGGTVIYLYEPILLIAVLGVVARGLVTKRGLKWGLALALFGMAFSTFGLFLGNDERRVLAELRPLLTITAALLLGGATVATFDRRDAERVLSILVWFSAAITLFSSLTGFEVTGRTKSASLEYGETTTAAARYLTPSTFLAVAIVAGLLALYITGRRASPSVIVGLAVPSLIIIFLSFSRNHLLGLGAAVLFALAASAFSNHPRFIRPAVRLTMVMITVASIVALALPTVPRDSWLAAQVTGYATRVIGGVSSDSRENDNSSLARSEENRSIMVDISHSPVYGYGFGYAYRPPSGPPGSFDYSLAPYYAHNYYLWLLVKSGIIGLLLFGSMSAKALRLSARASRPLHFAAGASLAAFLAISLVAPMPNGTPTSLLFGLLLGIALTDGEAVHVSDTGATTFTSAGLARLPPSCWKEEDATL